MTKFKIIQKFVGEFLLKSQILSIFFEQKLILYF